MPFTPIGSLGDIVALSRMLKDLIQALDETKGSSAQYQEIIRKLWAFKRVVQEVETVCRKREHTVELDTLRATTCCIANQARQCIKVFLKNIRKYEPNLSKRGSGNVVRDAFKKVQWRVCRSDELRKLQTEVDVYCSTLGVLLSIANEYLARLKDEKLHARLEGSEQKNAASMQEQRLVLDDIKGQLEENSEQVRRGNALTSKIIDSLGLDWIRSLSLDIKKFMHGIFIATFATYHAVADIQGRLPSRLERCLYQELFILKDCHARVKPFYLLGLHSLVGCF